MLWKETRYYSQVFSMLICEAHVKFLLSHVLWKETKYYSQVFSMLKSEAVADDPNSDLMHPLGQSSWWTDGASLAEINPTRG